MHETILSLENETSDSREKQYNKRPSNTVFSYKNHKKYGHNYKVGHVGIGSNNLILPFSHFTKGLGLS